MMKGLDPHAQELLAQYRSHLPVYTQMAEVIPERLKGFFAEAGFIVAAVEHRVKTEESLAGKLELKGGKYRDIFDITDIVGIRRDDTDLRYAGSNGLYWSSSLTTDSPFYALLVNFYSVSVDRNSGLRCLGFSVRPVSE